MTATERDIRAEAKLQCVSWNWNANIAEIAREMIERGIKADSEAFRIYGEEFVKFFGSSNPRAAFFWGICGLIVEAFG